MLQKLRKSKSIFSRLFSSSKPKGDINKKIARTYRVVNKRQKLESQVYGKKGDDVVTGIRRNTKSGYGTGKPENRGTLANTFTPDPFAHQSPLDLVRSVSKMDTKNLKRAKRK